MTTFTNGDPKEITVEIGEPDMNITVTDNTDKKN